MKNLLKIILFFILLTVSFGKPPINNEKRLISDLLNNYYDKYGRPIKNETEGITVDFELNLLQIIDIVTNGLKINF